MANFDELMDSVNMPQEYRALAKAIYGQESSSGKADTSKANYAGAIGPMQMTKPTFEGLKKAGWIPDDYDFKNPEHTTVAGLANIVDLGQRFGGDVRKVAAAYYAGPKAISSSGEIKPYADSKNPNAPNAKQYADQVVRRMDSEEGVISEPDTMGYSQFIASKVASPAKQAQQSNKEEMLKRWQGLIDESSPPNKGGGTEVIAPTPEPQAPEQATAPRSLYQKGGRIAAEVVGGLGGAALGAATPIPGGALAGGVAGASLGSLFASKTFDPLPDNEVGREAVMAGGMQGLGGVLGHVVGAVIRPKAMIAGGQELVDVLKARGITPIPSQVFEGQGAKILENIGEASLVGSGSLKAAREASVNGVRESAEAWKARWLAAEPQGARMLENVAQQAEQNNVQIPMDAVRNAADTMRKVFTNVDSAGRKVADDLYKLTETYNTLPLAVPFDKAMARNAAATAQAQASGVASTPQLVGAQQIRSELLDTIRKSSNRNEIAAARETVKVLDDAMSNALAKADPAMHAQWRMGNAFYRAGKQGEEISDIFSKALISGGETGQMGGKQLLNQIKDHRLHNLGTDLTDNQLARISEFGNAMKAAEGTGDHAFQFTSRGLQVSAVIQIVSATAGLGLTAKGDKSGAAEAAFAVALGPVALAKIFASPKTFRLMMAAMQSEAGTRAGAQAGTQFVLQAIKEGIIPPQGAAQPQQEEPQVPQ